MRKLFMAIFIPVMFVLGTPALIATIMYDGSGDTQMPVHLYTADADAEAMVYEELSASFDDLEAEITEDMVYNLNQDIINTAIFESFREQNPDYMPTDDCATDEACYVFAEMIPVEGFDISLRVVGAWVEFQQDKFVANIFLEVALDDGFTYKTVIEAHFKFTDLPGKYVLQFEQIKIGNLPIPATMISSILGAVESNIDDVNLDDATADIPVGTLDLDDFSYTLQKDEILDQIGENTEEGDTGSELAKQVLSIIFDQELLTFELVENEFVLSGRLSKFKSEDVTDIPAYLYDLHFSEVVEGETVIGEYNPEALDAETYLANLFTEYVFNNALIGGGFNITEETFNKLIYVGAEGFADTRTVQELELSDGEIKSIEVGLKAIWFEIDEGSIYANALFRVASVDSLLRIRADEVSDDSTSTELVFEFVEIDFGADEGETADDYLQIVDLTIFKQLLADLDDIQFGSIDENGVLTISAASLSAMMGDGSQEGTVNVTAISLVQDAIVLDVEPADAALAAALDDFSAALTDVIESEELLTDLESILDTTTEGPEQEVFNAVQDLQETLQDPSGTVEPEQIEALFENFEELDAETQEEFLSSIEDLIDPTVFENFEDLFGSEGDGTVVD